MLGILAPDISVVEKVLLFFKPQEGLLKFYCTSCHFEGNFEENQRLK